MMKGGWSIALLWVGAPVGVLREGITLQQSWKENTGKLPLGLDSSVVVQKYFIVLLGT